MDSAEESFIDDREITSHVREFLKSWTIQHLSHLSNPRTTARELRVVQSIARRIRYHNQELIFHSGEAQKLWEEMQHGSRRWPILGVESALDDHLKESLNESIPRFFLRLR